MTDCVECAKKLLDAAEAIAKIAGDKPGTYAEALRSRAEHYADAVDIVCPDLVAAKHKLAEDQANFN